MLKINFDLINNKILIKCNEKKLYKLKYEDWVLRPPLQYLIIIF